MYRGVRILFSWWVGLVMLTGGIGEAQEADTQDVPSPAVPAELRTWLTQTATPRTLPPGSYPAEELVGVLPPNAPQLLGEKPFNWSFRPPGCEERSSMRLLNKTAKGAHPRRA